MTFVVVHAGYNNFAFAKADSEEEAIQAVREQLPEGRFSRSVCNVWEDQSEELLSWLDRVTGNIETYKLNNFQDWLAYGDWDSPELTIPDAVVDFRAYETSCRFSDGYCDFWWKAVEESEEI